MAEETVEVEVEPVQAPAKPVRPSGTKMDIKNKLRNKKILGLMAIAIIVLALGVYWIYSSDGTTTNPPPGENVLTPQEDASSGKLFVIESGLAPNGRGVVGKPIQFKSIALNVGPSPNFTTTYAWDFGDGDSVSGEGHRIINHTYDGPSTGNGYVVNLTITNRNDTQNIEKSTSKEFEIIVSFPDIQITMTSAYTPVPANPLIPDYYTVTLSTVSDEFTYMDFNYTIHDNSTPSPNELTNKPVPTPTGATSPPIGAGIYYLDADGDDLISANDKFWIVNPETQSPSIMENYVFGLIYEPSGAECGNIVLTKA